MTAGPVIRAVGLTKIFRDFWMRPRVVAVENLDMVVQPGQLFGLLGPNGSGKSTTIKLILGLLYPTRGKLAVLGREPTDVEVKRHIGYLPEESYLYKHLTARETLHFYGQLFQLDPDVRNKRVDELLEMVGLSAVAHRRVGEFSKGMARRVGLAQALINDPDLIILDEPTTGMDPIGTRQIKDLLAELKRRGKSIILSSHLLADVEDICDELVILYGGRRRAMGRTGELLSQEDKTQITAPKLKPQTVNRIRELIAEDLGSDRGGEPAVTIGAPADRLESFFMRIVRQAETEKLATGGARNSGALAGFLRAETTEGVAVLDELVATAAPAKPEKVEQAAAAGAQTPRDDVMSDLIAPPSPAVTPGSAVPPSGAVPEPPSPQKPAVDEAVLGDLLGSNQDRRHG